MKINNKLKRFAVSALIFAVTATGCSSEKKTQNPDEKDPSIISETVVSDTTEKKETKPADLSRTITSDTSQLFSDRDLNPEYDSFTAEITLNGDSASVSGTGASCDGSVITVTDEGMYRVSGTLNNGKIIVNSQAKVQLVLDNADITCKDSAPVYVVNADKTFITLAEGSVNTLTDGSSYVYENETDNEPDAVIFSHDSLTVNGTGELFINANYNEGITSKDDIVITGGHINITSVGNAIKGKNYVALCNAQITIDSQSDGIKSTNIEEEGMGFVYVESGKLSITAAEDGIQSDTEIIIDGGELYIESGGGYENAQPHTSNDFGGHGGFFGQQQTDTSAEDSVSTKCIKASVGVFINDGTFNLNSADDTLHSNSYINISDGELDMTAGGDGIHADAQIDIYSGNVKIAHSYEGIEASVINVYSGEVYVTASDDGFNASDGTTQQGGMGTFTSSALLNIEGGNISVNADGDGLDSNGYFTVSGGEVVVDGPTNSGNGALDGNGEILINGGTLLAVGSSGMAEAPSSSSSLYSISAALENTCPNGSNIVIQNSDGKILTEHCSMKSFNHIVFSSEELVENGTYCILIDGEEAATVTISDKTTFIGNVGFGGGGFGGGRGDHGNMQPPQGGFGDRFSDMQLPTNENGEIEMPEMPEGGFGGGFGDMQPPTNENGEIEMPEMPEGGFYPFGY